MSTTITTELVKQLRDATGISVMQCKKALEEAEGDMDKALAILKKNSADIALKKADREVKAGSINIKSGEEKAVMVSLLCETDFVAKNEDFVSLLSKLTDKAFSDGVEKMKEESKEMIDQVIQKTGEKIELGNVEEIKGNVLGTYTHNAKVGVVVSLTGGNSDVARDIAMHITAMKPEYISETEIGADARKTMEEIFAKEVEGVNKPEDIKKKMLEGKIATYFKEKTLLDQPFIKNPDKTIRELLKQNNAEIKEVKRSSV